MSKHASDSIMTGRKHTRARAEDDRSRVSTRGRAKAGRYGLEELLEDITPENRHDEIDWGEPQGKEDW